MLKSAGRNWSGNGVFAPSPAGAQVICLFIIFLYIFLPNYPATAGIWNLLSPREKAPAGPAVLWKMKRNPAPVPTPMPSLDGGSGLLTINAPLGSSTAETSIAFRTGTGKGTVETGNRSFEITRSEQWYSIARPVYENVQTLVTHLGYSRTCSPSSSVIESDGSITALGFKADVPEQSISFGGNYASLSAEELSRLDLGQLEHLRNFWVSAAEQLSPSVRGIIQVKQAFTKKQTGIMPDGTKRKEDLKRVSIGGIGVEYRRGTGKTAFVEANIFDDEDFTSSRKRQRVGLNAGLRLDQGTFALELSGCGLTVDPIWYFGLSAAR